MRLNRAVIVFGIVGFGGVLLGLCFWGTFVWQDTYDAQFRPNDFTVLSNGIIVFDTRQGGHRGDAVYMYNPKTAELRIVCKLSGDVKEIEAINDHECLLIVKVYPQRLSSKEHLSRLDLTNGKIHNYNVGENHKYLNLTRLGKSRFILQRAQIHIYFGPFGWEPHGDIEGWFVFDIEKGSLTPVNIEQMSPYFIVQVLPGGNTALVGVRSSRGMKLSLAQLAPPIGVGDTRIVQRKPLRIEGQTAVVDTQRRWVYFVVEMAGGFEIWRLELSNGSTLKVASVSTPLHRLKPANGNLYYLTGDGSKSVWMISGNNTPIEVVSGIR